MTTVPQSGSPARSSQRVQLLQALARLRSSLPGIPRRDPAQAVAPTSFAQAGLWMVAELQEGSSAYNVPLPVSLRGRLDPDALRSALTGVVDRHEALRTTFTERDDSLYQVIGAPAPVPLPVLDLTGMPEQEISRRLAAAEAAPFDLSEGPVLRAELLRLAPEDHVLLLTVHHIACDGWSVPLLHAELAHGYNSALHGVPSELAPLPVQYADFATWQHEQLSGPVRDRLTGYWRNRLAGVETLLPAGSSGVTAEPAEGGLCRARITEPILARLDQIARAEGASRFMTVAALLALLLSRYTGRRDVLFGSTVAQRQHPDLRDLIGLFTNVFPIRADLSGNPTFRQLLSRTRQDLVGDYEGSALPFGLLVDALPTARIGSRTPLVQVHVQLEESDGESTAYQRLPPYDGLTVEGLVPDLTTAKFDLNFMLRTEQRSLVLDLVYARDLFDPAAAARLSALYTVIAAAVAADPDLGIEDLLLPAPPHLVEATTTTAPATAIVAQREPAAAREPTAETEAEALERVRRIWQEVLGVDEVPPHADFFDLGGNSFAALKVRRLLGGGVRLAELFRHRTAAALAAYLADGAGPENNRLLWPLTADDSHAALTIIAIPYAGGAATAYQPLADALPPRFRLWAASLPGHEGDDNPFLPFDAASADLVSEITERVSGPIVVYGHCAGASLAVSVAQGLEAQGADLRAVYVGASLTDPDAATNLARVTDSSSEEFYTYIKAIGGFNGALDDDDREQVLAALRHDMAGATLFQAGAHAAPGPRLNAPLHCVLGTVDPVTPEPEERFEGWSVFAETVRLELVTDGGHYFARDRAAELARIISATVPAAATARLPVICLPHTGAGASFFHSWQVRDDVEIIAPDLAGHDKRFGEAPHRTVHDATADLLPRVLAALDGRNEAVLVGHCLGGTVAFELAELLLQHDVRLRHLIISGTPGPTVPRRRRTTGLPDQQFLTQLEELAGYAHPALADPEMAALLLPVLRADQEMYENYRRSSLTAHDVPITVLRGTDDALVDATDSARWQEATTRPLRYLEVTGGHMYLAEDPGPVLEMLEWLADDADNSIETLRTADYPQPDWGLAEHPGPAREWSYDPGSVPRSCLLAAAAVVLGRYHGLPVTVLAVRESAAAEQPALVAFPTDPDTSVTELIATAEKALQGGWPRTGHLLTALLCGRGPSVEVRFHHAGNSAYPLTLTADDGLTVTAHDDLISPHAAGHFAAAVAHVAAQLLTGSGELRQLELLDAADQRHMRQLGTGADLPAEPRRIDEIIAANAAGSPAAIAVTDGRIRLTYAGLDQAANRVAQALRELGVEPGDRVGVCMPRGWELIVVLLGTLRAGASYLPMEPDNPPERLARMTAAATPRLVVTSSPSFPPGPYRSVTPAELGTVAARQRPVPPAHTGDAGDAAYVICTSGSTGTPKPVPVAHRSVTALLAGTDTRFRFTPTDVWAHFHSVAFDMSVWEIWGALITGGRLVVVPQEVTRNPAELHRLFAEQRVTVLNQTPTAFGMLIDADQDAPHQLAIRLVTFGGEPLDTRTLLPWFRRYPPHLCQLVNLYGITETTVHSTWLTVTPQIAETASRSVGVPLPGESLSIRDQCGRLLPPGVPGEIYVGGVGVALGYLGLPDRTAERFLVDPDGTRVFRSGDRGRMLPDGTVEHLGRLDNQVKIRGYRIELGEIRAALLAADGITSAAVVVGGTPDAARLDAYVTPAAANLVALRHRVRALLPEYMVPATFTTLDALPLTANGKLDQSRLPRPGSAAETRPADEDVLTRIWEDLTGLPVRGDDNIFDVGANSVVITKFVAQLQARGLAQPALSDVYRLATLRGLADLMGAKTS